MKRIKTIALNLVFISFILGTTGCLKKFDINNTDEVKKYLMANNFQYIIKNGGMMTSFLQFGQDDVKLILYNGEFKLSEQSFSYALGEAKTDQREILINKLDGHWKIKDDGNVYSLNNKGEDCVYSPFGDKRK